MIVPSSLRTVIEKTIRVWQIALIVADIVQPRQFPWTSYKHIVKRIDLSTVERSEKSKGKSIERKEVLLTPKETDHLLIF